MKTLQLEPCSKFYYDPEAAEKPIRFIERFAQHYEGRFAGQPFTLLDWQKDKVIRPLFGWKRRDTHARRFQELFLLTSKGAGKTPLLSAIGLFCLLADGEASPHVISMASSFEQANLTFENAKRYINQSKPLQAHCQCKQYQIRTTTGKWTLISGKPTGKSGSRPSCCIADEAHEWEGPTAKTYNLISANLFKRSQPLLLVATNAPASRTSFAYHLYERAVKAAEGKSDEETLLPVIYEADRALDWTSEEAAKAANPSIPAIITWDQLAPRLAKAKESAEDEAEYRRLYLSQQTQSARKWLDVGQWDACCRPIDAATIKDAAVYVGVDLSKGVGDLSAVIYTYVTPTSFYVEPHFWLPRATAETHEAKTGTPYRRWEADGHITLTPEATIGPEVKRRIAAAIVEKNKTHKIKAVCYDRALADDCIAALEAAGIVCVPIGQGWGVSRGCEELDRRLVERSITIAPNPVLRSHAEVVEVQHDQHSNYWPTKSGRRGTFAGKRSEHIDGISAMVTALTEARKHSFPKAAQNWQGQVYVM